MTTADMMMNVQFNSQTRCTTRLLSLPTQNDVNLAEVIQVHAQCVNIKYYQINDLKLRAFDVRSSVDLGLY